MILNFLTIAQIGLIVRYLGVRHSMRVKLLEEMKRRLLPGCNSQDFSRSDMEDIVFSLRSEIGRWDAEERENITVVRKILNRLERRMKNDR
jgi:hypothetical protein